jgi:hypothetical protein
MKVDSRSRRWRSRLEDGGTSSHGHRSGRRCCKSRGGRSCGDVVADRVHVNRHFVDLLPVWPAGVEYQQLIYRQTDLPEEYPTRQDLVRRLHWFDRESGGCIWDPESQPSTLASSLLPSSLPEPSSSSPPSSLPEPSSLATTSSQPSTLPAVPSQSQSTSRYNVKSHRETTLQEMQRQVYSESRKVQVLETAGQRERERLADWRRRYAS